MLQYLHIKVSQRIKVNKIIHTYTQKLQLRHLHIVIFKILTTIVMWNLISCNKLTQEKIRRKSYDKHVEKVNKMKSKLIITQPQQPWFVYAKMKKEKARQQQLLNIQKNNDLLLSKIDHIKNCRPNSTMKKPSFIETLNGKIMKDANEQILKENMRICQKIMNSDSFYKTKTILEKSNNLKVVMQNISANARRVQSARSLAQSKSKIMRPLSSNRRPQSSSKGSEFRQLISRYSESKLIRPCSAPSIKKLKPSQQRFKQQLQDEMLTEQN